jgi:hypothetical protein
MCADVVRKYFLLTNVVHTCFLASCSAANPLYLSKFKAYSFRTPPHPRGFCTKMVRCNLILIINGAMGFL